MFDNNPNNSQNRPLIALVSIVAVIIVAIIVISALVVTFSNREEANIINESGIQETSLVSEEDMTRVKKELYKLLSITSGADHDFDASVRWDTVAKTSSSIPETTFMIDVDEYQQSYRATVNQNTVYLQCPELGESKYPESFCISNYGENNDSIAIVFGANLPYYAETNEGETVSIQRGSSKTQGSNRYLQIIVAACPYDKEAIARAEEAVNDAITSLGASPNLFTKKFAPAGGCHEE